MMDIEKRVWYLERRIRRLHAGLVLSMLLLVATFSIAFSTNEIPDVIKAGRFEVVDKNENAVIVLGGLRGNQPKIWANRNILFRIGQVMGLDLLDNRTVARHDIDTLRDAVNHYFLENRLKLPSSLDVLLLPNENHLNRPYLKTDEYLTDPWGNPYVYVIMGNDFEIVSYGADGMEGGKGDNEDLSSKR